MGWTPPPCHGINVPEWKCHRPLKQEGAPTMQITTVGIDLAENIFQIHGVDQQGKTVVRKAGAPRAACAALRQPFHPCLIGIEAWWWCRKR